MQWCGRFGSLSINARACWPSRTKTTTPHGACLSIGTEFFWKSSDAIPKTDCDRMTKFSQAEAEQRARDFIDRWGIAPSRHDQAVIALTIEFLKVVLEATHTARTTVQTIMGRETR